MDLDANGDGHRLAAPNATAGCWTGPTAQVLQNKASSLRWGMSGFFRVYLEMTLAVLRVTDSSSCNLLNETC
jgi:hypothetical protein